MQDDHEPTSDVSQLMDEMETAAETLYKAVYKLPMTDMIIMLGNPNGETIYLSTQPPKNAIRLLQMQIARLKSKHGHPHVSKGKTH
jgi:hypothetical protein